MAKKVTLESLAKLITAGFAASDKKVAALAEDMTDLRRELKGDVLAVGQQVTSIETQLRGMNYGKLEGRVTNLEEKVFGAPRAKSRGRTIIRP